MAGLQRVSSKGTSGMQRTIQGRTQRATHTKLVIKYSPIRILYYIQCSNWLFLVAQISYSAVKYPQWSLASQMFSANKTGLHDITLKK